MTRDQALKQARKRWGAQATIDAHPHVSSPEKRATASATLKQARARIDAINDEINAHLKTLDWYVALRDEEKVLRGVLRETQGHALYYKFTVGQIAHGFFHVEGQGDTWEEAFAKADKAKSRFEQL